MTDFVKVAALCVAFGLAAGLTVASCNVTIAAGDYLVRLLQRL